jgi:hypothetical protein
VLREPGQRGLWSPAVTSQEMERAEVLFGQPLPALSSGGRPKVARHAAGQTFAVIVDLGQRLLTLVAASAVVVLGHFSSLFEVGRANPCNGFGV